jgi:hypothetical protein
MTEPKLNRDEIARLMGSELGRGRIIAFPDCALCDGSGQVMGGDEYQQCPDCRLRARRNGAADALALGAASLLGGSIEQPESEERGHGRESSIPAMTPAPTDIDTLQSAVNAEPGWEAYSDYSPLEIYQRESR